MWQLQILQWLSLYLVVHWLPAKPIKGLRWFLEGKEPAVDPNISEICNELNIDKNKVIEKANSDKIEKKYLANTENARNNKVFGSPSFIVSNEIFWGDDRMEDAITWSKK